VLIPPAYRAMIFSSRPSSRRCPLRTSWGSNRLLRSLRDLREDHPEFVSKVSHADLLAQAEEVPRPTS